MKVIVTRQIKQNMTPSNYLEAKAKNHRPWPKAYYFLTFGT